jgi:sugar transferase (PEP-CTERM/EpsH1 system associated)
VGGDRVRTFQFIKHLSKRHRVTVAALVEHEGDEKAAEPYRDLFYKMIAVPLSRRQSYINCVRCIVDSNDPLQVRYYASAQMRAALKEELARERYDVVVSHMLRMNWYLDDIPLPTVVDQCDAVSVFHRRSIAITRGITVARLMHMIEARRTEAYEVEAIRKADATIYISREEARHFPQYADKITVVPNGVDLDAFPFQPIPYRENHIAYMGNMRTFQNTSAATYLVHEVLPLIHQKRPDTILHIVGNEPRKAVKELHNGKSVIVTGRVDSVVPYIAGASVVVAPMRAVAGVQNKILESLALGTPVVTTSIGAEGLAHEILTVHDTPRGLADATLELMHNPSLRRERALLGRAYLEKHCTWEKALAGLDAVVEDKAAPRQSKSRSSPA